MLKEYRVRFFDKKDAIKAVNLFFQDYQRLHKLGYTSSVTDMAKGTVNLDPYSLIEYIKDYDAMNVFNVTKAVIDLAKHEKYIDGLINSKQTATPIFKNNLCSIYKVDSEEARSLGSSDWCIVQDANFLNDKYKHIDFFVLVATDGERYSIPRYEDEDIWGPNYEESPRVYNDDTFQNKENRPAPFKNVYECLTKYGLTPEQIEELKKTVFDEVDWHQGDFTHTSTSLILRKINNKMFDKIDKEEVEVMDAGCVKAALKTYNYRLYSMMVKCMRNPSITSSVKVKLLESVKRYDPKKHDNLMNELRRLILLQSDQIHAD